MDSAEAERFAARWAQDWNNHDLDALLSHFSDDIMWTSPVAAQVVEGSGGVLHGKAALRALPGGLAGPAEGFTYTCPQVASGHDRPHLFIPPVPR